MSDSNDYLKVPKDIRGNREYDIKTQKKEWGGRGWLSFCY